MRRFYPAVLERAAKETYGVWFPDFPDCVAAGTSQERAIEKAEAALAQAVDVLAEKEIPLPQPTALDDIAIPKRARFVSVFMVGVEPPDPSERVNVYLPKSLIARADRRAAEMGMSRSSFFGFAISSMIGFSFVMTPSFAPLGAPRSKAKRSGEMHAAKPKAKQPGRE